MSDAEHDPALLAAIAERRAQLRRTIELMDRWALVFERIGRGEAPDPAADPPRSRPATGPRGLALVPVLAALPPP